MNPQKKLGLGTVQFGTAYGVSGQDSAVAPFELKRIMRIAQHQGIDMFDTAPLYGDSEKALSRHLHEFDRVRVVTKTPHFTQSNATASEAALLRETFFSSLENLSIDVAHGLLAHRSSDLLRPNADLLWAEMEDLKAGGKVRSIGVSVYTPDELHRLLDLYPIDIVQLPMNLLDRRFERCGLLRQLKASDIEVHIRSVFLQGVLLTDPERLPDYFAPLRGHLQSLHRAVADAGASMLEASLNTVLRSNDTDIVLVGVDTAWQLGAIIGATEAQHSLDLSSDEWAIDEPKWVNPNLWKLG